MRLKRFTALGLAMITAAGLIMGCGGDSGSAADSTVSDSGTAAGTETLAEINAKLSEITEEKLNCDVELTRIGFSSFMQQLNLMLSSGEEFDLFVPMADPLEYVTAGQLMPIGDLVERFAPNLYSQAEPERWANQTFDGEIYGLPINGAKAQDIGFGMRKDICDELGINVEDIQSMEDLHDVLVQVKENYPDMYPIVSTAGDMFGGSVFYIGQNSCGDTYNLTVLEDPFDENGQIVSFFETDLFKETCERMYQWSQEGLVMPDASTNTDNSTTLVSASKGFGYFQHMEYGWEQEATQNCGTEMVGWCYGTPTYTGGSMAWFVPASSGDPERAVAFYDLMYSDPTVANLVINGIEGKNYVVVDEEKGTIAYPEGMDASSNGWARLDWEWPNERIVYTMDGVTTDYEAMDAFEASAQIPVCLGFKFDSSNVMNQITACLNVYEKYVPALLCGSLDPETAIPQLNAEMEDAGIQDIVNEKQAQFDEWRAAQTAE